MKTLVVDSLPGNFVLRLAGDIHEGTIAKSEHAVNSLVERTKAVKNGFLTLGGDQLESICVDDKRYDLQHHRGATSRIDAQRDAIINAFMPLKGRIPWILDGNHERRYKNQWRPTNDIAKALGAVYADGVMVKAIFPGFRLLDWHGAGAINSRSGDALQRATNEMIALKRKLRLLPADDCEIVAMHHIHKLIIHPPMRILHLVTDPVRAKLVETYTVPSRIYITDSTYRVPEEEKYYVACGSTLRGYIEGSSTYVEEAGYGAAEIGCIKLTVKADKLVKVEKEFLLR
jgi:hypothetical protein